MRKFDVAIIGSGSAGYVSAIRASQLGKTVCVIEKSQIGGTCLHEGCIPTKALLASVNSLKIIKKALNFGIKAQSTEIDFPAMISRKANIVEKLTSGINFLLKQNKIEIFQGTATIKEPGYLKIANEEVTAHSIIICSGSLPFLPFKIDYANAITSKEALELTQLPKSILIIGAGAIGIEFATIFSALGTTVVLIEMLPSILQEVKDDEIREVIRKKLISQKVQIIEGTKVEELIVGNRHVHSLLSSGEKLKVEKILIACGRIPDSEQFEQLGLDISKKRIKVNSKMQTNIEGIYAAGDVAGPPLLAHKASEQGVIAAENACGLHTEMDYNSIPNCIFSSPEIATVGQFAGEVKDAKIGRYDFQGVGKALCIGEPEGFAKVVADKNGIVKGVHIIGPHASDLIQIGVLAVKKRLSAQELGKLIYPHPTLSECLKEAFLDVHSSAIHKIKK